MKTLSIKINKIIPGYAIDSIVEVECDDEENPIDFLWRRKLKDAELDKCCEIIKQKNKAATKKIVAELED